MQLLRLVSSHLILWSCFQACFPDANTDKLESHIFRMYDTNGDGHIDFREFMIVLYIMSNGTPEENLKQVTKKKNFLKKEDC